MKRRVEFGRGYCNETSVKKYLAKRVVIAPYALYNIRSRTVPYDELWPYRPEVPEGGLKAICPHWHQPGLYKRFQLTLRPTDAVHIY